MSFEDFLQRLETNGISPVLEGGSIVLRGHEGSIEPELIELVSKYQEPLRARLHRSPLGVSMVDGRPSTESMEGSPLSFYQERLWIHYERNPQDLRYNIPVMFLVHGDLDVGALEESLNTIIARHESLRTHFGKDKDGTPLQFVAPHQRLALPAIPASGADVVEHMRRHLEHRFDLFRGPIFIATLLRLADGKHLLLLNVHHIATDAWSVEGIFLQELQRSYAAHAAGEQPRLAPLPVQYRDFARWQRTRDLSKDLDYWTRTLRDYEDTLHVPTDYLRHPKSGRSSHTFVLKYPVEFSRSLERFSRQHGCTMFMSLLAGLGVTLSRYASKTDLCIGTTTSGRNQVEVESLIGFFINILPLRLNVDEDVTIIDYLKQIRELTLKAFEHQSLPFERILHATGHSSSGNANPLVPVIIRHQNFPHASLRMPLPGDVRFGPYPDPDSADDDAAKMLASTENIAARCEIELSYTGAGSELEVEVVYASDLYERSTIERILGHHRRLLEEMMKGADRRLSEVSMLRDEDVQRLVMTYNDTRREYDRTRTFVDRFEAQVAKTPDATAGIDDVGRFSYRTVSARANQVAHALIERGIRPGDLVGVCMERGTALLVAMLAIWKAGAAYVPLDPSYPEAYLQQILTDATPRLVVCDAQSKPRVAASNTECLLFGPDLTSLLPYSEATPDVVQDQCSVAYVMYTSGSTGTPKGVLVPHRQLMNWLSGIESYWPFEAGEVVAQKTTMAFAVSVKELFAGLLNGCPQVFINTNVVRDNRAFVSALVTHRATRLNIVPSHLRSVLAYLGENDISLPDLKYCWTAGEPLTAEIVGAVRRILPRARLLNNYGCTEINDIAYYDVSNYCGDQGFVPIGTPIQNTSIYILDRRGRLVPEGVAGELHVDSESLPVGYHRRDELNTERFVANPFGKGPTGRLYNTGDVVRYLADGNIDYVGRWDFQVKVRGFRVDVRQVEKVLGDFPGVRSRAVIGQGEHLVAYYVADPEIPVNLFELREFLQERLPPYMVPGSYVLLDAMPQLPNGKFDRRKLLETRGELQLTHEYEPPTTETEKALATIWSDVLELSIDRVGRHTSFFEVGGHSLAATRIVVRIKDRFCIDLELSSVFDLPTLSALAAYVDSKVELGEAPSSERRLSTPTTPAPLGQASRLLEGKVALVTGASRGIGLATACLLAKNGAKVAINYRESARQALDAKTLIEREGGVAEVFQADVTQAHQVMHMIDQVRAWAGGIDVLVTNASIGFRKRAFVDYDWTDLEQKVTSELKAVFYPCQAVIPGMLERGHGSIIAMSSAVSKNPNAGFVAQTTAKAALDAFVRTLALELGPAGIRINTVAPGVTLTDAAVNMPLEQKQTNAAQTPLRRNAVPDDMAGAVLFLASDLSRFMTGTYLPVDGGFTML